MMDYPRILAELGGSPVGNELLYRLVGTHEAGHFVLCSRFGIEAEAGAVFGVDGNISGGITQLFAQPSGFNARFQAACIGWGGIVAEHLNSCVLRRVPGIPPLDCNTVERWSEAICKCWYLLSGEDWQAIRSWWDKASTARFALKSLLSPRGNRLFFETSECLVESARREHMRLQEDLGCAPRPEVRAFAERLINGLAIVRRTEDVECT
jgi:hypothetical protein